MSGEYAYWPKVAVMKKRSTLIKILVLAGLLLMLSACGGGGGESYTGNGSLPLSLADGL